jgi:hypothetical protein
MNIRLVPINMFASLAVSVAGGSITINGEQHELAALAAMPPEQPMPEFVVAAQGDSVTLLLPYWGVAASAVTNPEPLLNVPDGPVALPQ